MTARAKAQVAADTDADAVEELFKSVYPELAGWVRCLVDDDDTAHAIASEAFVRLLSRWTRVKSPRGYLYVTAASLAAGSPSPPWPGRRRGAASQVWSHMTDAP